MENLIKIFMRWLDSLGICIEAQIIIIVMIIFLVVAFVVCKGADYLEKLSEEEPKE